jgi:CRP-like cAMP-binding protein
MDALKQQFNQQIKTLMPISGLAPQYQNEVLHKAEILKFKKKQQIFKQGDVDPYTYYLLEGELELEANGQLLKTIKGGSPDAQSALSQLQPRQMGAKSKGKSLVMRIPRDVMDRLLTMDDPGPAAGAVEVSEVDDDEDDGGDWMTRMLQSELFSRIPPANIQRLFAVMESVPMKAGSVVVEQGSPGDFYYIIQAGRCEVTRKTSSSGAPIKLAELSGGDSFGEEALVSDAKRNATVTMTTDGELVRLTKEDFIELIKKPSLDSVDYDEAKALVAEGACWLDMRFPDEHAKDGIEASVNLPLNQLRSELKNLDADRIYIAYCDSGTRSSAGAFLLAQNGFDVRHLKGGLIVSHGIAPAEKPGAPAPAAQPEPEESAPAGEASELEAAPAPEPKPKAESKPEPKPKAESKPEPKPKAESKPEPVKTAPAAEAKVSAKSDNADVRASELAEDVAKADTRMEEAMRQKAQADAEQRAAAKKLHSQNKQLEEKAAKAKAELEKRAAQANAALEEAKRERVALEKARRAAEAEAEAKRQDEEQRLEALKKENEERLNAERAKLEAEYNKQAEELAKLQELKERARAELTEEREALERKASAANRELEKAAQARVEAEDIERRIREQSEAAIRAERQRLEAEFARAAEQLAEAQRERELAELIKDEAARKAARTIAEEKVAQELARQEDELRLDSERQKLREEAKRLRKSLEEAKKAKAKAQAEAQARAKAEAAKRKKRKQQEEKVARDMIAASHKVDPRSQSGAAGQDDELARANSLLAAAEAAHRKAEEAKQDLEDTQSWKKSELDALRKQMEAELSDFMNENPAPKEDDDEEKKRASRLAMFAERRKAEEAKRAEADKSIFDDVASQLDK